MVAAECLPAFWPCTALAALHSQSGKQAGLCAVQLVLPGLHEKGPEQGPHMVGSALIM